ncbi:MAG: hypothetical protein MZU97_00440 [Bacillus subtilis]|nr:hypothetical protein [Bacillus subtilis]
MITRGPRNPQEDGRIRLHGQARQRPEGHTGIATIEHDPTHGRRDGSMSEPTILMKYALEAQTSATRHADRLSRSSCRRI